MDIPTTKVTLEFSKERHNSDDCVIKAIYGKDGDLLYFESCEVDALDTPEGLEIEKAIDSYSGEDAYKLINKISTIVKYYEPSVDMLVAKRDKEIAKANSNEEVSVIIDKYNEPFDAIMGYINGFVSEIEL